MMAAPVLNPPATPDPQVSGPGRRRPRRHAEDPSEIGRALCGARLPRNAIRSGDGECPLCQAIINVGRNWIGR